MSKITERVGQAQARAYLSVDITDLPKTIAIREAEEYAIPVKNHGQSPAYNVSISAGMLATFDEVPDAIEDIFPQADSPRSKASMPPSGNVKFDVNPGCLSDHLNEYPCPVRLVLSVKVSYQDVFGQKNQFTGCFISKFSAPDRYTSSVAVRWYAHVKHNEGHHGLDE
jgi:hypothetical protein